MKPTVIALIAALVSGSAMYTVGARTATDVRDVPTLEQPVVADLGTQTALRPVATTPVRTVPRRPAPRASVSQSSVVREESKPRRSWAKTALIIGGSAAGGAGVGGAVGGKKGAITGAAIGGGAASIYEA